MTRYAQSIPWMVENISAFSAMISPDTKKMIVSEMNDAIVQNEAKESVTRAEIRPRPWKER
jgi:aromatic ring-cleaving dioxygenase